MMEDMDIDHVVDIPDTPDRPVARHINDGDCIGKESKLSVTGHLGNPDFKDEECLHRSRCRGQLVGENGHNRRLHMHHRKNPCSVDKIEHFSDTIALSPVENPNVSRALFRRTAIDKNSKHETRYSIGAQHMDKEKRVCSKFPSKSYTLRKDNAMIDLTEQNGPERLPERAFPHGKLKDFPATDRGKGQVTANGCSSLHWPPNSSKPFIKSNKGKEKIEDNTSKVVDSFIDSGKGIDLTGGSQQNHEKQTYASYHSVSPRVTGQKRLVRNGCISPYNIESRAKQLAERSQNCSNDVEQNPSRDIVSLRPCMIDVSVRDIVAEDSKRDRCKAVTIRPCSSKEHDRVHFSSSSAAINEVNGNSPPSRDAFGCSEELGGWRSTCNLSKKADHPLSNETVLQLRRNDDVGFLGIKRHESSDNRTGKAYRHKDQAQIASKLVLEPDQINQPRLVGKTLSKRQKKHELTSRNRGQSSRMVSDDSEIVFIGSSGESCRPGSSTIQSHQNHGIVEIDELSPDMSHGNSQGIVCINDNDSAARARQVEADEMLALRLQEQLYHELPAFGGDEIDADMARLMQQEEAHPLSNQNHHSSNPRTLSINSRRQPQSRLLPNPSNRRGIRARVHTSSGMEHLRNRVLNRSRAASSRARNLQFPLGMDLDMRLDILEALEAAVGDLSNTGTTRNISELQRDFNENDYEMLLALDENNHQSGASTNQINSLPLSTVQNDNFEEACAICLDTPAIGETIRHLPCMHKFHKDCIDPWLGRKSSCPVCKSSVT